MTELYSLGLLAGYSAEEALKDAAWRNAAPLTGYSPDQYRLDCDGRIIERAEYGRRSNYGWEIDHIVPVALGGGDAFSNVRARHWFGNRSAGGLLANALLK